MNDILLNTNVTSEIIKGTHVAIRNKVSNLPMNSLCISAITEAELMYGVSRKSEVKQLLAIGNEFLLRVESLPWDTNATTAYATLRVNGQKMGKTLSNLNMLIATHSLAVEAVLITNDQAFSHFNPWLKL